MRYLVRARIRPGREKPLLEAITQGNWGAGSVAGDEYIHNMREARLRGDGTACWVETCFCSIPLEEERPYWEDFFEIITIKDAHNRGNCRHENGSQLWACSNCDCTMKLEQKLKKVGEPLLETLSKTTRA